MSLFPLLPRKKNTDKRDYGHVLVVAGSAEYPGAALLTARAALVSGAGLVTLAVPTSIKAAVLGKFPPEIMPVFYKGSPTALLKKIIRQRRVNALAVGPGLGRHPSTSKWVRAFVRTARAPLVLDADGLNAFKGRPGELKGHPGALVLTPHAGEFERLFGRPLPKDASKRAELAKNLSRSYDVVLVLKGPATLTVYRDRMASNRTGNPGMAKGGSGDVLTGILAAFIAQGMDSFKAAVWGVHFHGKAGDAAVRKTGQLSLTASDLIRALPATFGKTSSLE